MAETKENREESESTPAKKIKIQLENDGDQEAPEYCLSKFQVSRILQNNCVRKQIFIEGTFKDREGQAIVLIEKKTFPMDEGFLTKAIFNDQASLEKIFTNDVFGNYICLPVAEHNALNVTVIHPATPKHIAKYSSQERYIVDETYELYKKITLPHIESHCFKLDWIYNILDHKAEVENIIYEDSDKDIGFVLVKDLQWDGEIKTLKLVALPFQNIKSIRDLNTSHLPLLRNILDAGSAAIEKKYNLSKSRLRIYFHYQPTYYYLHVHFSYLMFDAPGIRVEKAHLLSNVISNIEILPDYYQKAVLPFVVGENDSLYHALLKEGAFGEAKKVSPDA